MAGWIKEHVAAMKKRIETDDPIRTGDPLFAAVFKHASELVFKVKYTSKGVKVVENGTTTCSSALVRAHAAVVTAFINKGQKETQKKHAVPEACSDCNCKDVGSKNMCQRLLANKPEKNCEEFDTLKMCEASCGLCTPADDDNGIDCECIDTGSKKMCNKASADPGNVCTTSTMLKKCPASCGICSS
jgi:hypothetical protein